MKRNGFTIACKPETIARLAAERKAEREADKTSRIKRIQEKIDSAKTDEVREFWAELLASIR